jgi:hypothetical protein
LVVPPAVSAVVVIALEGEGDKLTIRQ